MDNKQLVQTLNDSFGKSMNYENFCSNLSNNKVKAYFKIWTKSVNEPGLTVQRKGNILFTLIGSDQPIYYFTRFLYGNIAARTEDKEEAPLGTTFSCYIDEESKELLDQCLRLYPTLVVEIEIPQMLEGINLTLSYRNDDGSIQGENTYDGFSILLPNQKIVPNMVRAYTENTFIPFNEVEKITDNYRKLLDVIKKSNDVGRNASLTRGSSKVSRTPRGSSGSVDYNILETMELKQIEL